MNNFSQQPLSVKIGAAVLALLTCAWIASFISAINIVNNANKQAAAANTASSDAAAGNAADNAATENVAAGDAVAAPTAGEAPGENAASDTTSGTSTTTTEPLAANTPAPNTADGLKIEDLEVGTGTVAETGDTIAVNYRGTLQDGTEFDSSFKRNEPFVFRLGAGNVIRGWDEGVVGMKVGGKRRLVIPPALAYGPQGSPPAIPPNATLTFEVELVEVQ